MRKEFARMSSWQKITITRADFLMQSRCTSGEKMQEVKTDQGTLVVDPIKWILGGVDAKAGATGNLMKR